MPILASRLPQPARLRQSKTKGPTPSQSPVAGPQVISAHGQSQARRSFLSPKSHWSPTLNSSVTSPRPVLFPWYQEDHIERRGMILMIQIAKYQLQDPGAVPGSPKVYKRTFKPPAPSTNAPLGRSSHTKKAKLPTQDLARNGPKPFMKPEARCVSIPSGLPQARPYLPPSSPAMMMDLKDPVNSPVSDVSIAATVATAISTSRPRGGRIPVPSPRAQMPIPTVRHSAGHRHMRDPNQQQSSFSLPTRNASSSTSSCPKSNCNGGRTDTTLASSSTSTSNSGSLARTSTGTTTTSPSPISSPVGSASEASPDMTLVWQPDPESLESEVDPAENLWKEIETRLGGRRMTGKAKRGQWVLTPRIPGPTTRTLPSASVLESQPQPEVKGLDQIYDGQGYHDGDIRGWDIVADGPGLGVGMERAESEFTVSAYFDPDLTTTRVPSQSPPQTRTEEREGTALFDMSAPLIYSRSNESATPANTPQIRAETIRRAPRVGGHTTTGGKGSLSSLALTSVSEVQDQHERYRSGSSSRNQSRTNSTAAYLPNGFDTVREDTVGVGIYRLDSHVVAALQALGGATPGAGLDMALQSSSSSTGPSTKSYAGITTASTHSGSSESSRAGLETDASSGMGSGGLGLGIGMHIRLDSIYSLITNTSPRWRTRAQNCEARSSGSDIDTSCERGRERQMGQEPNWGEWSDQVEKGKERMGSLIVTDLDTGHKLDLSLSRLDEMSYL